MKKDKHPIDDFFREALKDHEVIPSDSARADFLEEASMYVRKKPFLRKWTISLSLILLFAILGIFFYFTFSNKSSKAYSPAENNPGNIENTSTVETIKEDGMLNAYPKPPQINNLSVKSTKVFKTGATMVDENISTVRKNEPLDEIIENPQTVTEEMSPESGLTLKNPEIPGSVSDSPPHDTLSRSLSDLQELPAAKPDSIQNSIHAMIKSGVPEIWPEREWRISAGLYYAPEWMFNTLEGTKPATNFGIEGTFRIGPYSIRTGAGLSITKGTNQLAIEYQDYLGSYMKLDSMTFAWDEQHYYLIPTYFLTHQDVFDSLMKLDNAKVIKRYTYLQIPLILGYDFLRYLSSTNKCKRV